MTGGRLKAGVLHQSHYVPSVFVPFEFFGLTRNGFGSMWQDAANLTIENSASVKLGIKAMFTLSTNRQVDGRRTAAWGPEVQVTCGRPLSHTADPEAHVGRLITLHAHVNCPAS